MTDNPFVFDSEDTPYLKHHFQEKCWYRGKERIDANYFMIDPATMLMGWGKYNAGEGFSYIWQKDLFSPVARPDEEYKKAEDLAYCITEDHAHDCAWEDRYDERD